MVDTGNDSGDALTSDRDKRYFSPAILYPHRSSIDGRIGEYLKETDTINIYIEEILKKTVKISLPWRSFGD